MFEYCLRIQRNISLFGNLVMSFNIPVRFIIIVCILAENKENSVIKFGFPILFQSPYNSIANGLILTESRLGKDFTCFNLKIWL